MKRLIGTLLLTFTVFIYIGELCASGRGAAPSGHEAASSGRGARPSEHEAVQTGHRAGPSRREAVPFAHASSPSRHEVIPSRHGAGLSGHEAHPSEHGARPGEHEAVQTGRRAGPSRREAVSFAHAAGSSRHGAGPSGNEADPSGRGARPREHEAVQTGHRAGPSGHETVPSGSGAGPSEPELPEELRFHLTLPSCHPPNWNFYYRDKKVGVWVDSELKVIGIGLEKGNLIPDSILRRRYQITSYSEYLLGNYFLVYALPDGYIAGIENMPWNNYPRRVSRGQTTTIIYQGRRIDVWKTDAGTAYAIRLHSRNIVPTAEECMEYDVRTNRAEYDDMNFLVYTLRSGYIVGVLLV